MISTLKKNSLDNAKREYEIAGEQILSEKKKATSKIHQLKVALGAFKKNVELFSRKVGNLIASLGQKLKEGLAWLKGDPLPIPAALKERMENQIGDLQGALDNLQTSDKRLVDARQKLASLYQALKENLMELSEIHARLKAIDKELDEIDFDALDSM